VTGWTQADQAELDVLLHALAADWFKHRPTCNADPCPHIQQAIAEVLDWREARALLSQAQALRAELGEQAA
jgi:hypothetical protein